MKPIKLPKFPQLKIHAGFASAAIAIDMSGSQTEKDRVAIKATVKSLISELQDKGILFEFTLWAFDNFVHFDSIKKLSNLKEHIVTEQEVDEVIDWIFTFGRGGSSYDESFYFIKAVNLDVSSIIFITDGCVSIQKECPTLDEIEKHIFLLASDQDHKKYIHVTFDYTLTEIFI
jgi:hypothetical protein